MDVTTARRVLGLAADASWEEVRATYRRRIRTAHPDREGGSGPLAASLNQAYTTLARARRAEAVERPPRAGHDHAHPAGRAWWRGAPTPPPAEVLDGDTVHLPVPLDEAFSRLLEAAHHVGDVTYVDRSCSIFEALVRVEGEGVCSLLVTLQPGGPSGTDAFCTLEAIERVASPPVHHVVAALIDALYGRPR